MATSRKVFQMFLKLSRMDSYILFYPRIFLSPLIYFQVLSKVYLYTFWSANEQCQAYHWQHYK